MREKNSKRLWLKTLFRLIILPGLMWSCEDKEPELKARGIQFHFDHKINGEALVFNSMQYTNAAGNPYEVKEIMYFISEIKLYQNNGNIISTGNLNDIHYTDTKLPETQEWLITGDFPTGSYDSLSFTFGIRSSKNKSFMFVNPPEVNMAWPEALGGGYHYLMLNGWWRDTVGLRRPFDFHLGIGQIYRNNTGQVGDIIEFIDNSFSVNVPGTSFVIEEEKFTKLKLVMNVERWFVSPLIYDHNIWGGAIMQNQDAMHMGCVNGKDVFTLELFD